MKRSDFISDEDLKKLNAASPQTTAVRLREWATLGSEFLDDLQALFTAMHEAAARLSPEELMKARLAAERKAGMNFTLDGELESYRHALERAQQGRLAESVRGFVMQLNMAAKISRNPKLGQMLEFVRREPNVGVNVMQLSHQFAVWAETGFNTFNLTHGLTAGFILTEPPPLDEETFKLPFPSFGVLLPEGFLPYVYDGGHGWVRELWVHKMIDSKGTAVFQVTLFGPGSLCLWRRDALETWKSSSVGRTIQAFEDDPALTADDDNTLTTGFRIVRNLVAWLSANGPAFGGQGERDARSKKPAAKATPTGPCVWVLGREVKLGPELRRAAQDMALGKRHAPEGWKVGIRHVVRGHWKAQAHGAGRTLRKQMWIEPYWRGPEGAAAWAHLYTTPEGGTT